jgi:acyl carrier protein
MTDRELATAQEIVRIARAELGVSEAPPPDAPLAERLDSLQLLSLVVAVEDRFRVVLEEADAAGTRTLADLARLVVARADPALLPGAAAEAGGTP